MSSYHLKNSISESKHIHFSTELSTNSIIWNAVSFESKLKQGKTILDGLLGSATTQERPQNVVLIFNSYAVTQRLCIVPFPHRKASCNRARQQDQQQLRKQQRETDPKLFVPSPLKPPYSCVLSQGKGASFIIRIRTCSTKPLLNFSTSLIETWIA